MKKVLPLIGILLACLSITNKANAQSTFAPLGAEWWYYGTKEFGWQGEVALDHFTVEKDSLYMGQSCRALKHDRLHQNTHFEGTDLIYSEIDTQTSYLFLYAVPDTVFFFNDLFQKFTPLYVFNANEGDTVCLPAWSGGGNPYANGDTAFCFVIDSIRMIAYDTTHLKTYFTRALSQNLSDTVSAAYNWGPDIFPETEGTYTDVTGGLFCGILPGKILLTDPNAFEGSPWNPHLRCYSDANIQIHIDSVPCDYMPTPTVVGVASINNPQIPVRLYPNPTANSFTLSADIPFPAVATASLSDMYGRCIKRFSTIPKGATTITYDISGIAPGMYFLKIQSPYDAIQKKIVITR